MTDYEVIKEMLSKLKHKKISEEGGSPTQKPWIIYLPYNDFSGNGINFYFNEDGSLNDVSQSEY